MIGVALRRMKAALSRGHGHVPTISVPHAVLGTEYGAHCVATEPMQRAASPLVYSFGLGEDVSFDLELIERFGARVVGFDPTPRSIAWLREQSLPATFEVVEQGIAAHDGTVRFYEPANPTHISHSVVHHGRTRGSYIEVEVRRLDTLMAERGDTHLDVLKLDVEGAEYEVLDQLLASSLRPTQILVEFHHHLDKFPAAMTRVAIDSLLAAGYGLFHVAANGRECSFLLGDR